MAVCDSCQGLKFIPKLTMPPAPSLSPRFPVKSDDTGTNGEYVARNPLPVLNPKLRSLVFGSTAMIGCKPPPVGTPGVCIFGL